jgi:hypothetical protein
VFTLPVLIQRSVIVETKYGMGATLAAVLLVSVIVINLVSVLPGEAPARGTAGDRMSVHQRAGRIGSAWRQASVGRLGLRLPAGADGRRHRVIARRHEGLHRRRISTA